MDKKLVPTLKSDSPVEIKKNNYYKDLDGDTIKVIGIIRQNAGTRIDYRVIISKTRHFKHGDISRFYLNSYYHYELVLLDSKALSVLYGDKNEL